MVGIKVSSTRDAAILSPGIFSAADPMMVHSDNHILLDMQTILHCLLSLQWYSDLHPSIKEINCAEVSVVSNPRRCDTLHSFAQLVLAPKQAIKWRRNRQ